MVPSTSDERGNGEEEYYSSSSFNAAIPLSLIYTCFAHCWIFFSRRYSSNIENNQIRLPARDERNEKKIAIITGSNTGIGFQTATRLVVDYGWEVVLACRTKDKALRAMESINDQAKTSKGNGNATVLEYPLDLSDFSSVTKYAQEIRKNYPKVDVLINNAGINTSGKSNDNLDMLFQSNFLGHFLLTNLLIDNLKSDENRDNGGRGGRIINLSSVMHHFSGQTHKGDTNFWKLMATYTDADEQQQKPESNYAASKLAMILFSQELNHRYGKSCRLNSIAVNPGSVASDIWRSYPSFVQAVFRCIYLSPEQGCKHLYD